MSLGNTRTLNWGKEAQEASLNMTCKMNRVSYRIRNQKGSMFLGLFAKDWKLNIQLPVEWECELVNEKPRHWKSYSLWDGSTIASGVSQRDVIYRTILKKWK